MKYVLFFLITILSYKLSFSQTPSTVGQVYNFEVGDTFEYQWYSWAPGCGINGSGYIIAAITSKAIVSDTITYLFTENATPVTLYPGSDPCNPTTYGVGLGNYPLIVANSDSSVFTLVLLPCDKSFSSSCFDSVVTDSLYHGRKQDIIYYLDVDEIDDTLVDGLGAVYSYGYDETDGSNTQILVYYHKATGETWGTPLADTLFTGVNNLANNLTTLKVFPNPATNTVTVDYSLTDWGADASLIIVNELGQVVYNQPVRQYSGYQSIDVSKYATGIYTAYMKQNEQVMAVQRFAKE